MHFKKDNNTIQADSEERQDKNWEELETVKNKAVILQATLQAVSQGRFTRKIPVRRVRPMPKGKPTSTYTKTREHIQFEQAHYIAR